MCRLRLLSALAALLLAACDGPAEFSAALGPPGTAPYDARLIGRWYALEEGEDGVITLTVEAGAEEHLDGAIGFVNVNAGPGKEVGFACVSRTAHATVIDGRTYYSTRLVDGGMISKRPGQALETEGDRYFAPSSERGFWIMRAEIGPDEVLTLEVMTDNAPKAAGHAARRVECGEDCDYEIFDLTPDEIADLIRTTPPDDLFRIRLPMARFGRPPPPKLD